MRIHPREFPPGRRRKPKRRAEREVYEALAGSDRRGFAYYEWRRGYECIELDFAVWVEGLGRFGLQVKGGRYLLVDGEWHLKKRAGLELIVSCPLDDTKLGALDLHDDIKECACTSYNPFVIPVLLFTDMTEPNEAIENLAKRKGVYVVWGAANLLFDLARIVRSRRVAHALSMNRIADEVFAVTDGMIQLGGSGDVGGKGRDGWREIDMEKDEVGVRRVMVGGRNVITIRPSDVSGSLGQDGRRGRESEN